MKMVNIQLVIPWEKYGTIAELAKKIDKISPQFGRTVLQKMIYILQEVFYVPCGYQYSFYIYGPYSADLASDLDYVEFLKGVNVQWVSNIGGYHISSGEKAKHFCEKAKTFLKGNEKEINKCIEEFGNRTAGELELIATIIYINRYNKRSGVSPLELTKLADMIKEIKPKFKPEFIIDTAKELSKKGYI